MTETTHPAEPTTDQRQQAWERYASIWKIEGAEAKLAACAEYLDAKCVYTDPNSQLRGWDELVTYMVEFHEQIPGGHFVTTEFATHHGRCVAHWNMVTGDGTVAGSGVSYGEFNAGGLVATMTGFFDTPEE